MYRNAHRPIKQLDVVASPSAFLWNPYLPLTNVIFDDDNCDSRSQTVQRCEFLTSNLLSTDFFPVTFLVIDGHTESDA